MVTIYLFNKFVEFLTKFQTRVHTETAPIPGWRENCIPAHLAPLVADFFQLRAKIRIFLARNLSGREVRLRLREAPWGKNGGPDNARQFSTIYKIMGFEFLSKFDARKASFLTAGARASTARPLSRHATLSQGPPRRQPVAKTKRNYFTPRDARWDATEPHSPMLSFY